MNLVFRILNNLTAIIVSIIFLVNILCRLDIKERKNKVFIIMVSLNTFELIVETLTCIINRQPYMWLIPVTTILHVFLFITGPIVIYLWCLFVTQWVNEEKRARSKSDVFIMLPVIINTVLVILSPLWKAVFYISENNVYQRGRLFFIPVAAAYFYLVFSLVFIFMNRKRLNKMEFLPLLLFGAFPTVGGLIQSLFYGILLMWSSIAFSLILLYIYLQQQMLQLDYLTGAWSREKLHIYLNKRIAQNKSQKFSIVFMDMDNFKKINDNFGHSEGDKVLKNLVQIIKKTLRSSDSVTRYGGDEFILFLNVDSSEDVKGVMKRIDASVKKYNNTLRQAYKMEYSYGYELYDFESNMTADQYISHVDKLMYKVKKNRKAELLRNRNCYIEDFNY